MSTEAWPSAVSTLVNPVTRTVVRVEPPIEIGSDAEGEALYVKFAMLCKAAWDNPGDPSVWRCDPAMIPSDWLRPPPMVSA